MDQAKPHRDKKHGQPHRRQGDGGGRKSAAAKPPQARPARAGLPARLLAVKLLDAVLTRNQPLDQAWAKTTQSPEFKALEARDRGLVRLLVATSLRREGELEAVLARFLEKPLPADQGRLRPILLIGAAQLACLDMPAHAVVDLSVELVRRDRQAHRFDKLTNAVMRRVSEQGKSILAGLDGVQLNVPGWLLARWEKTYGAERARAIAAASLKEAPVDLTLSPAADAGDWASKLSGMLLPTGSIRLSQGGALEDIPGYADGVWWVQDAAAALVSRALGDVTGLDVADLCAAPGGKTASLASRGAKVTAVDLSEARLSRLKANLQRLNLQADVVAADIATWEPGKTFDAVLLDAPCSATGTIRRHPDLLRQKTEADIERLSALQTQLLENAQRLVRPGGLLVYSTCSLEPEEGEAQIARFLSAHSDFRREPIDAGSIGALPDWITPDGDLRTLPDALPPELSGIDGFYVARLRKA
ncbi:MAG: methyltransferase domain-containing protein [Hyphomicrobiales bacterium]|nr:MAG: methyltransferase domain-containing protein [Hyphomicrobiales bacterium]